MKRYEERGAEDEMKGEREREETDRQTVRQTGTEREKETYDLYPRLQLMQDKS